MLVSSIARFSAMNTMNNAAFGMMQTTNSMLDAASHASAFGGESNLSALHEMDKRFSLDLITNRLLYKLASLQEKMAKKHQDANIKRSFSTFA